MSVHERVRLNIGGVHHETTTRTLRGKRAQGSILTQLSPNQPEHFYDRNGKLFHYVLDYLRDGHKTLPSNENVDLLYRLYNEAEFFKLDSMRNGIRYLLRSEDGEDDERLVQFRNGDKVMFDDVDASYIGFARVYMAKQLNESAYILPHKTGRCLVCGTSVHQRNDQRDNNSPVGDKIDIEMEYDHTLVRHRGPIMDAMQRIQGTVVNVLNDGTCVNVHWEDGYRSHTPVGELQIVRL